MKTPVHIRMIETVALLIALAIMLFPIYWMVNTALKPAAEVFQSPPSFFSANWSLDAFRTLFETRPIGRYFLNSFIVAGGTTVLSLALASLAAYGLTRFSMRIEGLVILALLFIKMLPEALLVVPFYQLVADVGLLNSYVALILVYSSFALPFAVWMLIGFFRVIPRELDEAGIMDGATRLQTFRLVVLPLARPGIVAVAMFTFLTAWNAYLWALVLTTDPDMYVLPVGIATMKGEYQVQWNELMAAAVVAVLPVVAIYSVLERHLVAGITAGAVKG
ncbi:carbohydrate ABC transporter permease [Aminobacter aganoensis]|uniref:ABC-type glycerol-3-phosphate transport system permease component n=1 Tax=Aminobacter aganoensis TaxID=83264 RepID=A0A7X0FE14_9HYPH|nr:carbohydrate ABC transporter permease [Aminobacter aganoensis]MBB6357877.1 ABC-type glycerol-3-phosphate transport system permease component [Aminobacter aganoensis]